MNKRRTLLIESAFLAAVLMVGVVVFVLADSVSRQYPTAYSTSRVAPESDNDWVNETNIGADDNNYASITASQYDTNDISFQMLAQDFGFSIPTGATIDGIVVEYGKYCDAGAAVDYRVQLLDGSGTLVGDNNASSSAWPGSETMGTYGSDTEKWNASPSVSMVNDPDFGVCVSVQATQDNTDVYVDYIRMTIFYTPGADEGPTQDKGQGFWIHL